MLHLVIALVFNKEISVITISVFDNFIKYILLGLPVIVVQVRSEENNELHMTTFQTYTCIVDHLILKYEISVAVCIIVS